MKEKEPYKDNAFYKFADHSETKDSIAEDSAIYDLVLTYSYSLYEQYFNQARKDARLFKSIQPKINSNEFEKMKAKLLKKIAEDSDSIFNGKENDFSKRMLIDFLLLENSSILRKDDEGDY